jgi:hypothetical protein
MEEQFIIKYFAVDDKTRANVAAVFRDTCNQSNALTCARDRTEKDFFLGVMQDKGHGRPYVSAFLVADFVHMADEMGRRAGYCLHDLSNMIINLVPGYFEPAPVDSSCLSSFIPRVVAYDVAQRIGADHPVAFSDDDRPYLAKRQ